MRKLLAVLVLLFYVFITQSAQAVTVWYQPTPYPDNILATIPESERHFAEGFVDVDENWNVPTYINPSLQQSDWLNVGGASGYRYLAYLKFDLTGLPKNVDNASLWLAPGAVSSPWTYSPYAVCPVLASWSLSGVWAAIPAVGTCNGWYPSPTAGYWSAFWLSYPGYVDWYNQWQNGTLANNGVMVYSQNTNYALDPFVSSRYAPSYDGSRPILQLTFAQPAGMPGFKMPLPGGHSWLLSNEIGGYECMGQNPFPDPYHQDTYTPGNYYSIDITGVNKKDGGGSFVGDVPIIAAAGGKVVEATYTDGNGWYVVLDHDGDGNLGTGYSTRYLHMKPGLVVTAGATVQQGDLLGYMGNTGISNGVHLHFGVRYQNQGYSYISQLSCVVVNDWLLKSFQTECGLNAQGVWTWIRYYHSSNRAY